MVRSTCAHVRLIREFGFNLRRDLIYHLVDRHIQDSRRNANPVSSSELRGVISERVFALSDGRTV